MEVWTRYLALQEQLIQQTLDKRPSIAAEAERKFDDLPGTLRELKQELSPSEEKGLSDELLTGSLPSHESTTELRQIGSSVNRWIGEALDAHEVELDRARSQLRDAKSAVGPLLSLSAQRQRKQEVIAKIVIIIADVLRELERREEEQRRLDKIKGKSDRMEPTAALGTMERLGFQRSDTSAMAVPDSDGLDVLGRTEGAPDAGGNDDALVSP
jgi:hypothetical protein